MPEISAVGFRHRGTVGAAVATLCGLVVIVSVSSSTTTGPAWNIASYVLAWLFMIAGGGVRFWSTLYIGGRKNDVLVMDGPYSICRNPLYLGTFLLQISAALFFQSLVLFLGVVAVAAHYLLATIPAEERLLRERFTTTFDDYCRRVPRIVPQWSSFQTPDRVPVKLYAVWLEVRRCLAWIWLPAAAYAYHHFRYF